MIEGPVAADLRYRAFSLTSALLIPAPFPFAARRRRWLRNQALEQVGLAAPRWCSETPDALPPAGFPFLKKIAPAVSAQILQARHASQQAPRETHSQSMITKGVECPLAEITLK